VILDQDVGRLRNDSYERAKTILTSRRDDLERLAHELMERETIDRTRLEALLDKSGEQGKETRSHG